MAYLPGIVGNTRILLKIFKNYLHIAVKFSWKCPEVGKFPVESFYFRSFRFSSTFLTTDNYFELILGISNSILHFWSLTGDQYPIFRISNIKNWLVSKAGQFLTAMTLPPNRRWVWSMLVREFLLERRIQMSIVIPWDTGILIRISFVREWVSKCRRMRCRRRCLGLLRGAFVSAILSTA